MSNVHSRLRLNREEGRFLGVCAGVADYLEVPAALIRIIFAICVLSWFPLILLYFFLYICLDKGLSRKSMGDLLKHSDGAEHFRKLNYRRRIYRNTHNKRIAGVCAGIADYLEINPLIVRLVAIGSLFVFGPYTVFAYVVCVFVLEKNPHSPYSHTSSYKTSSFNTSYGSGKQWGQQQTQYARSGDVDPVYDNTARNSDSDAADAYSLDECGEIYNSLELRLREIEAFITSRRFRLHCEINRI